MNNEDIKPIKTGTFDEIAKALEENKRVINLYGEGGVGKTTTLQVIADKYHVQERQEKNLKDAIEKAQITSVYYMDVSACVSDYEIFNNIVNVIENESKKESKDKLQNKSEIKFTKFHIIYKWYLEERKLGFQKRKSTVKEEVLNVVSSVFGLDLSEFFQSSNGSTVEEESETIIKAMQVSEKIWKLLGFGINLGGVVKCFMQLHNQTKNKKIIEDLFELTEGCKSDLDYRRVLRKCLIDEWKELCLDHKLKTEHILFIMDNYRLKYSVELNTSSVWLKELVDGMGGYWLIGSRIKIDKYWDNEFADIKVVGFEEEQAKNYIEQRIKWNDFKENFRKKNRYNEKDTQEKSSLDKLTESEKKLSEKILEVCKNAEYYLPYQLNLVAHFINNKISAMEDIIPEDIITCTKEEFVDYYYFSHMSEMVVAAVQLLSCIPAWNKETYKLLKSRFNYHYLEAEYLMHRCAFVENIDDVLKLHEAIRDAVVASENNYIIIDVNKYLCREMAKEILENKAGNLIVDYYTIIKTHLKKLKAKDNDLYGTELKSIKDILEEIHKIYEKKENVTLEYADAYRDVLSVVYGNDSVEYIEKMLECGDLYTKLYMPKTAHKIEEECLEKLQDDNFKNEYALRVKAYNWVAYDYSKDWDYDQAYTLGKRGLVEAYKTIRNYNKYIISDKVSAAISRILYVYSGEYDLVDEQSILHGMYVPNKKKQITISQFEKDYSLVQDEKNYIKVEKEIRKKILDLLEDQYNKLRGNFPWYCIRATEKKNEDTIKYGINTYYIRKTIFKVNRKSQKSKIYEGLMLKSLENIAKYMFKQGTAEEEGDYGKQLDNAIWILEHAIQKRNCNWAVLDKDGSALRIQRKMEILNKTVDTKKLTFVSSENESRKEDRETEEVKLSRWEISNKISGHCICLYEKFNFSENIWNILYKDEEILEAHSYLGDIYLKRKWYYEALEKLSFVLLHYYINDNIYTSGMMDTYCRAAIALCGLGHSNLAEEFMVVICNVSKEHKIQCPDSKKSEYIEVWEKIEELNCQKEEGTLTISVEDIYGILK